ncbi:hypothetical protein JCM8097_001543 [Rhodosporidiobolus ruineniae]
MRPNDRVKFAIGEIGLGIDAPMSAKVAWLKNIIEAKNEMPNFIAVSWFNYWKDSYSYKVVDVENDAPAVKFLLQKS